MIVGWVVVMQCVCRLKALIIDKIIQEEEVGLSISQIFPKVQDRRRRCIS